MKNLLNTFIAILMVSQAFNVVANNWINIATPDRINEIEWIDGILYIGSNGGLIEYNPVTQEQTHSFRTEGLPSISIEDISKDKDGNIWIGTYDNGVAVKKNGQWETKYNVFSQSANVLLTYCLEIDDNGVVWSGTSHGIYKLENNIWSKEWSLPVWDMKKAADGTIWAAAPFPLKIENGGVTELNTCPIFAYADATITVDTANTLFFSAPGSGVAMYKNSNWFVFSDTNSVLPNNSITDLHTMTDGKIAAIAVNTAVYTFDGILWKEEFSVSDLASLNYQTTQLNEDLNGNIIVGTVNSFTTFDGNSFSKTDLTYKHLTSNYSKITTDPNGDILVKSLNEILIFNAISLYPQKITLDPLFNNLNDIIMYKEPSSGNVIYFNPDSAAININGVTSYLFNTDSIPFKGSYVRSFLKDAQGNYWIGTLSGLYKTNGSSYQYFDNFNSPFTDIGFWALGEDRNGKIWASTPDGIGKWDGTQWSDYYAGIDYGHMFSAAGYDFYFDDNNDLWFGGWGTGLVHFDGTTWEAFTITNSGIADHIVYDIESDGINLFVATRKGVSVFDGTSFIDTFTIESSQILANSTNQLAFDGQGNLWMTHFGNGISVYNKNGVVISSTTSAYDVAQNFLNAYPNPASNQITIDKSYLNNSSEADVSIYSITGRKVASYSIDQFHSDITISIDKLIPGMYILELNVDGVKQTGKFIKE